MRTGRDCPSADNADRSLLSLFAGAWLHSLLRHCNPLPLELRHGPAPHPRSERVCWMHQLPNPDQAAWSPIWRCFEAHLYRVVAELGDQKKASGSHPLSVVACRAIGHLRHGQRKRYKFPEAYNTYLLLAGDHMLMVPWTRTQHCNLEPYHLEQQHIVLLSTYSPVSHSASDPVAGTSFTYASQLFAVGCSAKPRSRRLHATPQQQQQ